MRPGGNTGCWQHDGKRTSAGTATGPEAPTGLVENPETVAWPDMPPVVCVGDGKGTAIFSGG